MDDSAPLDVAPPVDVFNFAQHLLQRNTGRGDKPAYVDDRGTLSYGQLDERVRRLAAALKSLGVRPEERVLLLMQDCNDWPVAFLGSLYAGAVPVAVNTLLTADDYAYMLEHSRAQMALVSGALLPVLNAALIKADHEVRKVIVARPEGPLHPSEVELESLLAAHASLDRPATTHADDPAFWLYSSGSTGRPKGTVHSHANPYWTAELYGRGVLGLREDDVCFSAAKLFFAYGLGNALSFPLSVGATTLLMPERPTPRATFARWRGQHGPRPTVFFGAPTGYAGMLADADLPRPDELALRMASSAGEALPAEIGQRFKHQVGVDIVDGLGSTEMLHCYVSNTPDRIQYGCTGWPVPGYRIELRGDDGQPVPDGEPGDLYVQGPSSALMYWGNRVKTRETFQGDWTKSGDKYIRQADGSYLCAGRTDDMLKVSGIYVSPFEVEATLIQHPEVLEAAVIGVTDAQGLTKTKAYVVRKPGTAVTTEALQAFAKQHLAPYKYPRQIEFVDELPKTATGKIQRFRLRALNETPV
ncbi:MAG: benzoate-CoA ligase family protein [Burkholderiales bacterium]|nr:benzoate-CoA ligase family protein [Burkholderiales bacterium]MBK8666520.1 benzoate-CoA ligase family protein [Burkholderiales bacterium]